MDIRKNIPRTIKTMKKALKLVKYENYEFSLHTAGGRIYLHAQYLEPDVTTGEEALQSTRKWYISHFATDSEIVQTALKCALTSAEHRVREHFTYRNERVFSPHFNIEDLVKLSQGNING